MERDVGRNPGGYQAVWQDLVARLESPAPVDPSATPWPDRENVSDASPGGTGEHDGNGTPPLGSRGRVIRPAGFLRFAPPGVPPGPGPRGHPGEPGDLDQSGDLDEDDDRYVPPPPPRQPKLDPVAKGAWTALFGGPGYLFLGTLLNWQFPPWAELAAIVAFVAGFVVLVFRLGDGPSRRDGPDQGAVV